MKALAMSEAGSDESDKEKNILYFNILDMSKKFSEINAELTAKEKITAAEFATAKLAFSEMGAEDQEKETATINALEKKVFNESAGDEGEDDEAKKKEAEDKAKADQEAADAEAKRIADEAEAAAKGGEGTEGEQKEFSEKVKSEV